MNRKPGRGFTLAELLIVIAIIAVVIALIVPALGGSRNAARASVTSGMMTNITRAVSSFSNENAGAMPGPFTARQMSMSENLTRGMSMGENVMLGLMGWQSGGTGPILDVGPTSADTRPVAAELIGVPGAEGKQYWAPDKKYYVPQFEGLGQMGAPPHAAAEGAPQLPDVVDAWGAPLLFWMQDDTYIVKPSANNTNYKFARDHSGNGTNPNDAAKFYWAQNACFLTAPAVGKRALNQTDTIRGSMLSTPPGDPAWPLYAFLGNPNAPWRNPQNLNAVPTRPLSGRSPLIVQSAGIDGYYLGKQDKGAKQFSGTPDLWYGINFAPNPSLPVSATNQYLDKNGKPTNIDVMAAFDDLFTNAGS